MMVTIAQICASIKPAGYAGAIAAKKKNGRARSDAAADA
jgi:hypothetical protein